MPQKISALPVKAKVRDTKTKYYGVPIGWVIGDKNHAGYPANSTTLVAESIIKICCFDATESGGNTDRERYGNNRYSLANIRQWLNKSGTGWYQAQHSYDRPPSNSYVWSGYNEYDAQSGFLTGFGAEMLAALLTTTLTVAKPARTAAGPRLSRTRFSCFPWQRSASARRTASQRARSWLCSATAQAASASLPPRP